jgi:hypothetical protein
MTEWRLESLHFHREMTKWSQCQVDRWFEGYIYLLKIQQGIAFFFRRVSNLINNA